MSKSKANQARWNGSEITFVDIRLESVHREQFSEFVKAHSKTWADELAEMCADGYKFSMVWDDYNVCFIVSATGREEGSPNYNKCMSARSVDFWEAQQLLLFKHLELAPNQVWPDKTKSNDWG